MSAGQSITALAAVSAVNILGFALMGADKRRARRGGRRIRERTLLCIAIFAGALGVYAGVRVFRHKTRHRAFSAGVLLMLLCQIAAAYLLRELF